MKKHFVGFYCPECKDLINIRKNTRLCACQKAAGRIVKGKLDLEGTAVKVDIIVFPEGDDSYQLNPIPSHDRTKRFSLVKNGISVGRLDDGELTVYGFPK